MNKKDLNEENVAAREELCNTYLNNPDRLPLIVFSDEKLFKRSVNNSKVLVRRRKGTSTDPKNVNLYKGCGGNADVNVYMAISRLGKACIFLAERTDLFDQAGTRLRVVGKGEKTGFDGESYYLMVRDLVLPLLSSQLIGDSAGETFEYMQDNATIHTTENLSRYPGCSVKKLMKEQGIDLVNWPPNSPDLNPVEHVWSLLNRMVKKCLKKLQNTPHFPKNKKEHWDLIRACWTHLDNQKVVRIYQSFARRLAVVRADGGQNNNKY